MAQIEVYAMERKMKFCPYCGKENEIDNVYCGSCGSNMNEVPQQQVTHTIIQTQPTPSTPVSSGAITTHMILGIIGLILGVCSLFVFSWLGWFVNLWVPFLFLGLSIVGIILSAISIKGTKPIGITGLVLNILGGLSQVVLVFWVMVILAVLF